MVISGGEGDGIFLEEEEYFGWWEVVMQQDSQMGMWVGGVGGGKDVEGLKEGIGLAVGLEGRPGKVGGDG